MGINLSWVRLEGTYGEGILKSVKLEGKWVPCDTLLIGVGSAPNVAFLDGSGLLENGKLLVSSCLQSHDPKIFAAGDAVTIATPEGKEITPWTWPQAVSQGKWRRICQTQPSPKTLTRPNP
jgi:3-phenylpropionate/trans-cinnamate dioxygenase ferredoxin reductase subunit